MEFEMSIIWSTDDAYELVAAGTYLGQAFLNRFTFHPTTVMDSNEDVQDVLEEWVEVELDVIQKLCNQATTWTRLRMRNLSTEQGTHERIISVIGENGGATAANYCPPALSVSFRLYTSMGISRSGWKRFVGVLEGDITSGALSPFSGGGLETGIPLFQAMMTSPFITPAGNELEHTVWGLHPTLPGYTSYPIVAVSEPFVGTQNSRKVGHGD